MSVVENLKEIAEAKAEQQRLFSFIKDQVIDMLIYDQDKISELKHPSDVKFPAIGREQKSIEIKYHSGARLFISVHTVKPPEDCL